jgi:predicted DNA-binding transcriptional regulator AlpA
MLYEQHPRYEAMGRGGKQLEVRKFSDECLIASKSLKELLGNCSDMHIWRLLNEEKYKPLAFPKPFKINDRNYWRLGAVRGWIREQEAQSQASVSSSIHRSKPTVHR